MALKNFRTCAPCTNEYAKEKNMKTFTKNYGEVLMIMSNQLHTSNVLV